MTLKAPISQTKLNKKERSGLHPRQLCLLPLNRPISDLQPIIDKSDDAELAETFSLSANQIQKLRLKLQWILTLTGARDLKELSENNPEAAEELIADTRDRILATLPMQGQNGFGLKEVNDKLQIIKTLKKGLNPEKGLDKDLGALLEENMQDIRDDLDEYLKPRLDQIFVPAAVEVRSMMGEIARKFLLMEPEEVFNDVVRFCNDPGKLLTRACLSQDPKERFEYDLRLELILLSIAIKRFVREWEPDMEFFTEALDQYVLDPIDGKRGALKTLYLVAKLDLEHGNRCLAYDLLDTEPLNLKEDQFLEKISCRGIRIDDDIEIPEEAGIGPDRMIYFGLLTDQKSLSSLMIKGLRDHDREMGDAFRDINRTRMPFMNAKQRELALYMIERRLPYPVRRDKERRQMGGDNGKGTIPCYKFNWLISDGGRERDIEVQCIDTYEDLIDFHLREANYAAWCFHEIDRFFEKVFDQLFTGECLDKGTLWKVARGHAYQKELQKRKRLTEHIYGEMVEVS